MSGYDIWILGYGTWILWCDFIHWWNDTLRSQYSIVMWWCVIIMTNMLFNIEYCIINSSKSGSGTFMPGYWIVIYQNMTLQRHYIIRKCLLPQYCGNSRAHRYFHQTNQRPSFSHVEWEGWVDCRYYIVAMLIGRTSVNYEAFKTASSEFSAAENVPSWTFSSETIRNYRKKHEFV